MVRVEPGSHGNHIETFKMTFPQLEFIQPHALQAFDLLVGAIESQAELPPSQRIPRGGTIAKNPARPGHCTNLLAHDGCSDCRGYPGFARPTGAPERSLHLRGPRRAPKERWNAPGFKERCHAPVRPCPNTVACGFCGRIGADRDAR